MHWIIESIWIYSKPYHLIFEGQTMLMLSVLPVSNIASGNMRMVGENSVFVDNNSKIKNSKRESRNILAWGLAFQLCATLFPLAGEPKRHT